MALLVATTDVGHELFEPRPDHDDRARPGAACVPVAGAHSFDPEGDGGSGENDELAAAAVDGQATTSWRTETYDSRAFGNLKKGVGLVLDLGSPTALKRIAVTSPTTGWAAVGLRRRR